MRTGFDSIGKMKKERRIHLYLRLSFYIMVILRSKGLKSERGLFAEGF